MKALRSVLIVEPSEIICNGLRSILESSGEYNVLSEIHDASTLMDRLNVARPDVLIVNPTLLSPTPRQQISAIGRIRPTMPVVALVYQYVEQSLLESFRYVLDIRSTRSTLLSILHDATSNTGNSVEPTESTDNYELSDRETDVLVLVAKGLSSKEIADKLHISVHTVNSHRKNITHKTGIKSVAGLAVYAMIHNLME